jgi:formiminotetrahydrofolate cyclodeaminase
MEGTAPGGAPEPIAHASIDGFLDALASAAPTPGGGAAAALSGALGAALVAMVCRVTASRGGDPALAGEADDADRCRAQLVKLAGDDAAAYGAVIAARRAAPDARAAALERATRVPVEIATAAHAVLVLAARVVTAARATAIGDLQVAAALAWGALDGAALTARLNLRELADAEFRRASADRLAWLVSQGEALRRRVSDAVAARIGGTGA